MVGPPSHEDPSSQQFSTLASTVQWGSTSTATEEVARSKKKTKPSSAIWNYFDQSDRGRQCIFCKKFLASSQMYQSTAAESHLLQCKVFESKNVDALHELVIKHAECRTQIGKQKSMQQRIAALKTTYAERWSERSTGQQTIIESSDRCTRKRKEQVDQRILDFVYETASPFTIVDDPSFHSLIKSLNCAYPHLPSRREVGSVRNIERKFQEVRRKVELEIERWSSITLAFDGWTSVSHDTLINVVYQSLNGQAFLAGSHNLTLERSTTKKIIECLQPYLEKEDKPYRFEDGESKICGLCSDSASNMRATRKHFEKVCSVGNEGCRFHSMDLVAKKFFEGSAFMRSTCSLVNFLSDWIRSRSWINASGREIAESGPQFQFASIVTCSHTRKLSLCRVMDRLCTSRATISYLLDKNFNNRFGKAAKADKEAADNIMRMTGSENFIQEIAKVKVRMWHALEVIVKLTRGLEYIQRLSESSTTTRSYLYMNVFHMKRYANSLRIPTEFKFLKTSFVNCVEEETRKYTASDLISLLLDPRRCEVIIEKGQRRKIETVFSKDYELWSQSLLDLNKLAEKIKDEDPLYASVQDKDKLSEDIRRQVHLFDSRLEKPNIEPIFESALYLHPWAWWRFHGRKEKEFIYLYPLAKRSLGMAVTSSGVERINSQYLKVHSKLRNRLGAEKAYMLAYIYINSRQLREMKQPLPAEGTFSDIQRKWEIMKEEGIEEDVEEESDVDDYADCDKTETEYKKIEYDEEESSSSQSADEEQSPESSDISQEISDVLNDL